VRHGADEGLESIARRSDEIVRAAQRLEEPSETLLQARFSRIIHQDPESLRTFSKLAPAEKRLVVELSEAAQQLGRRFPDRADTLVRQLGPEGLTAVRVFGDDVAEVLAKEGTEGGLNVLRKTGRKGWNFFTHQVLPHKKKLAAAGLLAAFLADPDRFVDYAGRATEYAVKEFGKAGIQLATAVGGGAARGLESTLGTALSGYGLNPAASRMFGMILAAGVIVLASLVLLGIPLRGLFAPVRWVLRPISKSLGVLTASRS
jgi:hypothetical protein